VLAILGKKLIRFLFDMHYYVLPVLALWAFRRLYSSEIIWFSLRKNTKRRQEREK